MTDYDKHEVIGFCRIKRIRQVNPPAPLRRIQMAKELRCKHCNIKITIEGSERYDELCFKCAVKEFDKRIMEEALAYGYGYDEFGEYR